MDDLKIVAMVDAGWDQPGLVLNRPLKLLYEFEGRDLIGKDGPFRDALKYKRPSGRFKAFGGREFDIPMVDGTTTRASGQYWQAGVRGCVSVATSTVEQLRKCYVFNGGSACSTGHLADLRAEYGGPIYPYREYEKIIKYDQERSYWINRAFAEERAKRHVISNLRAMIAANA